MTLKRSKQHSTKPRTLKPFVLSIVGLSAISLIGFAIWWLMPQNTDWPNRPYIDEKQEAVRVGPFVRNRAWVNNNFYRIDSYRPRPDGNFDVTLLSLETSNGESFDELIKKFWETPYSTFNHNTLAEGVNCQGMVFYIASWCQVTNHSFEVRYTTQHVTIVVDYGGERFEFSFTLENPYIQRIED